MNALYTKLQATTLRLITKYGTTATITRKNAVENPETGVSNGTAATTGTFKIINPPESDGKSSFDNRMIELAASINKSVRFYVIAASGATFAPLADDTITIDSLTLVILGCTPIAPAGTASTICYKIGAAE
jgi:predicted neuraminidase